MSRDDDSRNRIDVETISVARCGEEADKIDRVAFMQRGPNL